MRGFRSAGLRHAAALAILLVASTLGPGAALGPALAAAQASDGLGGVVPDSVFEAKPHIPARYLTTYTNDKSRNGWTQSLDYNPSWKNLAMNVSAGSGTSEDALRFGSRSTNGDLAGKIDWRASQRLVLSLGGTYSMSSIADGVRASGSEQRRNNLSFQSQYRAPTFWKAQLTVTGSSDFQRNYDLRTAERTLTQGVGAPDLIAVESDSSYASGRLDAVRGRLLWPMGSGVTFLGSAYGSRNRPITTVHRFRATYPIDGTAGDDSIDVRRVQLPADNALLSGTLTIEALRSMKFILESTRNGIDQVYFDLGQLKVEQYSSDGHLYHFRAEGAPRPGFAIYADAAMRQSFKEYVARPNLNALVITRNATGGVFYNSSASAASVSFDVNRTRAERQKTGNGITLTRALSTNFQKRAVGRLWLVGLGSATLSSYRYLFTPSASDSGRTFSPDDRDVASAFGSFGARFAVTPRCSTAANFSASRTHNVAIDALQSAGNIATTVYQLNGSIRLPLRRNLSIGQDYIVTATYRAFDYNEENDGLSRNFRIETTVSDTLFPFAYLRLDHRYYFFDQGEFSPIAPGGPRLYGVSFEQAQQTLEGTIGVQPMPGVRLEVRQSVADIENRSLVGGTRQGTDQWNLSLRLDVNRSFWNGAGLTGSVRREERFQNLSGKYGSVGGENNWIASITFQKEF